MTLAALLWMVMAWQQAQQCQKGQEGILRTANQPDVIEQCVNGKWTHFTLESGGCFDLGTGAKVPCAMTPFDVPPVETPTGDKFLGNYDAGVKYSESDPKLFIMNLNGHNEQEGVEYRRSCLDKSRFLLMSEDGRWHCLSLGQKP